MELSYQLTNTYETYFDIKLQGKLNDAHWFYYEHDYDSITIAHDTDEDIITTCETLGDTIDVWINGDRTECKLEVKDVAWSGTKVVLIEITCYPEDNAIDNGPYDVNAEVHIQ